MASSTIVSPSALLHVRTLRVAAIRLRPRLGRLIVAPPAVHGLLVVPPRLHVLVQVYVPAFLGLRMVPGEPCVFIQVCGPVSTGLRVVPGRPHVFRQVCEPVGECSSVDSRLTGWVDFVKVLVPTPEMVVSR